MFASYSNNNTYLNLGEISIIIAVACKHRDEAYILSRYILRK